MSNEIADKQHLIQKISDMQEYAILSFQSESHTNAKLSTQRINLNRGDISKCVCHKFLECEFGELSFLPSVLFALH